MKKLLLWISASLLLLAGCEQIDEINARLDEHEGRIAALEEKVAKLTEDVAAVKALLSGKYFVQDVVTLADDAGYKLVLVDGSGNVTEKMVYNGEDGEDGDTPMIGIRQDTDGNYYWTLNGSWLLSGGQKVRANGEDGLTPEFKIEDGKWYIKVTDQEGWKPAGDAVASVVSMIASIDASSKPDVVIFTMTNGTTVEIPKGGTALKLQLIFDDTPFADIETGTPVVTAYRIIVPKGVTYTFDTYEPEGWDVIITSTGENVGNISIFAPEGTKAGKVLFVLNGSDGSCFVKVVSVGVYEPTHYAVNSDAGQITVEAAESISAPEGVDWISVSGNKLNISANTGYDPRSAVVTYLDAQGKSHTITIVQAQVDAIVLPGAPLEAPAEGAVLPFVISANVIPEVSADVEWIHPVSATKALNSLPYTITVDANHSAARSGKVTFSYGSITQSVTINQEGVAMAFITGMFEQLTDASDLAAGDVLLIVNKAGTAAMGGDAGNYRNVVAVSAADGVLDDVPEDVVSVTLEGSDGAWNLKVGDGKYLTATSSNSNYLKTVSSADNDLARWTISISNGVATIKAKSGSKNQICYNESASRFSCYGSVSSTIEAVAIYKQGPGQREYAVAQYSEPGSYLLADTWTYSFGADQHLREYDGDNLTYVLMNPSRKEQMVVTGFKSSMVIGDSAQFKVEWRMGVSPKLDLSYKLTVVRIDGAKVWLGDAKGNGLIIKK